MRRTAWSVLAAVLASAFEDVPAYRHLNGNTSNVLRSTETGQLSHNDRSRRLFEAPTTEHETLGLHFETKSVQPSIPISLHKPAP